eukprot:TRINITY_DN13142_c0_g1_i1.p1 TRINITY_DN13142_c0_g1~~TRINITY_DN13142_c0_g1_i1.p1  ORF type:complete len:637 (+),score=212.79 TRINITY_DN13142_c0_g1_i1:233-1912(+)
MVIGVLIKCDRSSEFVRKIPALSPVAQRGLKALIQSFQLKLEEEEHSSTKLEDVERLLAQKEAECRMRESKLQEQIAELRQERAQLNQLYDKLQRDNESLAKERDELHTSQEKLSKEIEALQEKAKFAKDDKKKIVQMHQMQELIEQSETLRAEKEKLSNQLNDERRESTRKLRSLQDENDTLRDQLALEQQEKARLQKLSKKLVDYQELQSQNKNYQLREEQNLQTISKLQFEADKVKGLVSKIQQYNQEIAEYEMKVTQLTSSISAKDEKINKLNDALQAKTRDYDNLLEQSKQAQKEHVRKPINRINDPSEDHIDADTSVDGHENALTFVEALTPEIKAKIARLERENEHLREAAEAQHKLETVELLNKKYKEEIEKLRKSLELKDLDEAQPRSSPESNSKLEEENKDLKKKLSAASEKIQALTTEKNKLTAFMASTKELIHKLKDDQQTKAHQESTSAQQSHQNEILALKHQLQEKDKEIEMRKIRMQESKAAAEKELQLVKSAFYELALELQKIRMSKLTQPSPPTNSTSKTQVNSTKSSTYLARARDQVSLIK